MLEDITIWMCCGQVLASATGACVVIGRLYDRLPVTPESLAEVLRHVIAHLHDDEPIDGSSFEQHSCSMP